MRKENTMKIGIVVYSQTGNTYSVAQRLAEKLASKGHDARIERIKPLGTDPASKGPIRFEALPDLSEFDRVIFASPVQAFSLAPVMKAYLTQIGSIKDKKAACFVTQQFKNPWMGGNSAVKTMQKLCAEKGGHIADTGVVNWSNPRREEMIIDVVERLSSAL